MKTVVSTANEKAWRIFGLLASILLIVGLSIFLSGKITTGDTRTSFAIDAIQIQTAVLAYYTEYSVMPEAAGNAELIKALTGENPRKIEFLALKSSRQNSSGEMLDRWGTPYQIRIDDASKLHMRSAGPDKIFGTADDINNE